MQRTSGFTLSGVWPFAVLACSLFLAIPALAQAPPTSNLVIQPQQRTKITGEVSVVDCRAAFMPACRGSLEIVSVGGTQIFGQIGQELKGYEGKVVTVAGYQECLVCFQPAGGAPATQPVPSSGTASLIAPMPPPAFFFNADSFAPGEPKEDFVTGTIAAQGGEVVLQSPSGYWRNVNASPAVLEKLAEAKGAMITLYGDVSDSDFSFTPTLRKAVVKGQLSRLFHIMGNGAVPTNIAPNHIANPAIAIWPGPPGGWADFALRTPNGRHFSLFSKSGLELPDGVFGNDETVWAELEVGADFKLTLAATSTKLQEFAPNPVPPTPIAPVLPLNSTTVARDADTTGGGVTEPAKTATGGLKRD